MRRLAGALALLALLACDPPPECVDTDGDGFGPGCEGGEDCDPDNAGRNVDCVSIGPPDCDADPLTTGCPCLPGGITECLEARAGVGVCAAGTTRCLGNHWGLCEGGQGPSSERCDGRDEDCDGLVDEGVLSPCGGCNPACRGGVWGSGPVPFDITEGSPTDGLELTTHGELTLAIVERAQGAIWAASAIDGRLSRIDAEAAVETARYATGGAEPSRVAVDHRGDAWVLNREFGGVSSLTKVAGALERCVDVDESGAIETSGGPELVLEDDECVLLHVPVGGAGGLGRALAIDGDRGLDDSSGGDAWVGLHDAEAIVEIDGLTGEERTRIETPGFRPYAATFDRWGTLWVIERDGRLARVDVRADPPTLDLLEVPFACFLLYGLAADLEGRLVISGFSCDQVFSYDPTADRWSNRVAPASPRGVAFDGVSSFWMAHTGGLVSEVRVDPLAVVRTLTLASEGVTPFETIGVGVDAAGRVYGVSAHGGEDEAGLVTRLDPSAEAVDAQIPIGRSPHLQGDLTGTRVRFGITEEASLSRVFEGCGPTLATEWSRVHIDASPGSDGHVRLEARRAATRDALAEVAFDELGTIPESPAPYELSIPDGGVLEVRVTLSVDSDIGAPRVRRVGVEWRCPGPD